MMARIIAAAGAVLLLAGAALADPVGRYTLRGTNPGDGKSYVGAR